MQLNPTMICDRCGTPQHYIQIGGTNGMVQYKWDLCKMCLEDVKAMMLNANNRFAKPEDEAV